MRDRRSFLRPRRASERLADLTPFVPTDANPWDAAKARHLLRRLTIGARADDVDTILQRTPGEVVDRILDAALNRPRLPEPSWMSLRRPPPGTPRNQLDRFNEANAQAQTEVWVGTLNRLLGDGVEWRYGRMAEAFLERLTVFWSNHYVVGYRDYRAATWLFRYRALLRTYALGSMPDLLHQMGTEPAMLRYLNGDQNTKDAPNENYARELLELFTMGVTAPSGRTNYTQADIVDLARMLTGWTTDLSRPEPVLFDPKAFDDGPKRVFGRTGTGVETYDDVVPLVFDRRAWPISYFICTKLYQEYVSLEVNRGVVGAMAATLRESSFEIAPVLRKLFKSAHFYKATNIGALIKSPVETLLGTAQGFGLRSVDEQTYARYRYRSADLDQDLFNPPDVKGWRTGQAWINTSTITGRAKECRTEAGRARDAIEADAIARPSAYDARALARDLYVDLLTQEPDDATLDDLTLELLGGADSPYYLDPDNPWDPTKKAGRRRVRAYVDYLVSLPDYQLR